MDIIIAALITSTFSAGVTLFVGFKLSKGQDDVKAVAAQIEIKVDGRLEAALGKIDNLENRLSSFTGFPAPPLVAGQSGIQSAS